MAFFNPRDFIIEVAKGNIPGHELVNVSGENADVDTSSDETIWTAGGSYVAPTAARVHDLASTSANDAAAGTGAQSVRVTGLDASYNEISETKSLNGITNVPTDNSYLRINSFEVTAVGSGLVSDGTITATAQTDATVTAQIEAGRNMAQQLVYTVPADKIAIALRSIASVGKNAGTVANVEFYIKSGVFAAIMYRTIPIATNLSGTSYLDVLFDGTVSYAAQTDIEGRASSSANNAEVAALLTLLVADVGA